MTVPPGRVSPLRSPMFRAFWVAGLLSSLCSWVHLVAAAWLMTTLTSSAAPVALLITATSIPTFLLSWAEYERLVARTTVTEGEVLARVEGLHAGPGRPDVRSYLGHRMRRPRSGALAGDRDQPGENVYHQENQR